MLRRLVAFRHALTALTACTVIVTGATLAADNPLGGLLKKAGDAAKKELEKKTKPAAQEAESKTQNAKAASGSAPGTASLSATSTLTATLGEKTLAPAVTQLATSANFVGPVAVSDDGNHAGGISMQGSRYIVTIDGQEGKPFDQILSRKVEFSSGGKHSAYVGLRDEKQIAVVDGKESPGYALVVQQPAGSRDFRYFSFSTNGTHVAYIAKPDERDPRRQVVVDGAVQYTSPGVDARQLVFAGNKATYLAQVTTAENHLVVGGKESPGYAAIFDFQTNEDGHFAYLAARGKEGFVVVDGTERSIPIRNLDAGTRLLLAPRGTGVIYRGMVTSDNAEKPAVFWNGDILSSGAGREVIFSPDGTRTAAVVALDGSRVMVVSGSFKSASYNGASQLQFSPDGKRIAFVATNGTRSFAVVDGKESNAYTQIKELRFSPDSKHYAFKANTGSNPKPYTVVLDGTEGTRLQDVVEETLVFSPDGRLVYGAAESQLKSTLIVDGNPQSIDALGKFSSRSPAGVAATTTLFSPDGSKVAYVGRSLNGDGKVYAIVNDQRGPAGNLFSSPVFSADSKHFAVARWNAQKWYLDVDGKSIAIDGDFIEVPNALSFSSNNSIRILVVKDALLRSHTYTF